MFRQISTRQRKAQSTVEYIVLVAAVLAVIIAFVSAPGGPFQSKVKNSLNDVTEKIEDRTGELQTSLDRNVERGGTPSTTFNPATYNAFGR